MFGAIFWTFVGCMIGWNLLPQPKWAKGLWLAAAMKVEQWRS